MKKLLVLLLLGGLFLGACSEDVTDEIEVDEIGIEKNEDIEFQDGDDLFI